MASSAATTAPGAQISTPSFDARSWLRVANDSAGAPGTEVEALLQNGRCPDDHGLQPVNESSDSPHSVFFSDNMRKCYGYENQIGADTVPLFRVPWWWRTEFTPQAGTGQHATLIVNGVIGKANVWVNGHEVATSATVTGAYTRFAFDIAGLVRPGTNSVAIEVNPNNPETMFTLDDVDWNQIPPDNNTGIQFPVQLAVDGALSDGNAHVLEANAADFSRSTLTVKTDITNHTGSPQTGDGRAWSSPRRATHQVIGADQDRNRACEHHEDGELHAVAFPGLTIETPAGLVAVPARRPAAVPPRHVGLAARQDAELHQRDVRHPDRDVLPDRAVARPNRPAPGHSRSTACRS